MTVENTRQPSRRKFSFIAGKLTSYTEQLCSWIYDSNTPLSSDSERVRAVHEEASNTIRRVFFAVLGTSLFCIVTLAGSNDVLIFNPAKEVKLPVLSYEIDFNAFLLIGPLVLIGLITYLHIFVGFQRKYAVDEDAMAPILPNMTSVSAMIITWLLFYWLVPLSLILFAWKAAPHPLGPSLHIVSICILLALVLVQVHRCPAGWRRSGTIGLLIVFALSVFGIQRLLDARVLKLPGEDFTNANLENKNFDYADLEGAKLIGAKLAFSNFRSANLRGTDFTDAIMSRTILYGALLHNSNLTKANMAGAEFGDAQFKDAILLDTDLRSANFTNTYLVKAKMNGANLDRAILTEVNLQGADLSGATMDQAEFVDVKLKSSNLSNASLVNTVLVETTLACANMTGADVSEAEFIEVDLRGADLTSVTGLSSEQLAGSFCDPQTRLPDGFKIADCPILEEGKAEATNCSSDVSGQ